MDKPELTAWAKKNGWRERGGVLTLSKPSKPDHAIVRMMFLATVVHVEIRKPAGKWERVGGASYRDIVADEDTGVPGGLGLDTLHSLQMLMQENRDQMVFAAFKP